MKIKYILYYIIICFVLSKSVFAAEIIVIDNSLTGKNIGHYTEFIQDLNNNLTINDITTQQLNWQTSSADGFPFGYTEYAYWFRFTVENISANSWYLDLDYRQFGNVDFFNADSTGSYKVIRTGVNFPFHTRDVVDRDFVFHISPLSGSRTYYLRIKTLSPLNFSPKIWSSWAYPDKVNRIQPFLWMFYGIMIIMVIYNFFIYLSVRHISYVYCVMFICSIIMLQFQLDGFTFQFLHPNSTWWIHRNTFFWGGCVVTFQVLFIRSFIESEINYPRFDKIIKYTVLYPSIIFIVFSLIFPYGIIYIYKLVMKIWIIYAQIIQFMVMLYGKIRGSRQARFLFYGFTFFLVCAVVFILETFGMLSSSILFRRSLQIGSATMVVIFSLGLGDRINVLKNEMIKLNASIIKSNEDLKIFRKFSQSSSQGMGMFDLNGTVTYVNPAFCRILGYKSTEMIIGEDVRKFFDEQNRLQIFRLIVPEVLKNGEWTGEMQFKNESGVTVPVIQSVFLIEDNKNELVYFATVLTDITQQKTAEEAQLKSSKIESLGIFAGGLAHDFNNLLTAIIGNISIARHSLNRSDEVFKILAEAEKASLRAKDLTHHLLTFSKGGTPVKSVVSIKNLLKENVEFVLSGSYLKCEFDIENKLWNAEVDEGQISQVIHNVVLNARQSMTGGGLIFVSAKNNVVDFNSTLSISPGFYVRICIRDAGMGISDENIQKIFDPYFTTREEGSGLGLSVSYSIVKKHGGNILVSSVKGTGTEFNIYLPATSGEIVENEIAVEPEVPFNGKILLMDDDDMILKVGSRMLKALEFEVVVAKDGEQAIELYMEALKTENPIDIVIMDLTIPCGMGGKDAIVKLNIIDPRVRAIVSSGYSNDPVMANYREYGFSGVVSKPYRIDDLERVLSEVFNLVL